MKKEYGIGIIGSGHHLPSTVESNEDLCRELDGISPEWILEKTGITQRYIADKEDTTSGLALSATIKAINKACINSKEVKQNNIFFGIRGKKIDGNKFANEAIKKGASFSMYIIAVSGTKELRSPSFT